MDKYIRMNLLFDNKEKKRTKHNFEMKNGLTENRNEICTIIFPSPFMT